MFEQEECWEKAQNVQGHFPPWLMQSNHASVNTSAAATARKMEKNRKQAHNVEPEPFLWNIFHRATNET